MTLTRHPSSRDGSPAPVVDGRPTIRVEPTHRVFIAGATGSGKSTLATAIGNRWPRVLVYDPKVDDEAVLPNAAIAYGVKAARRALPGRVIYRPTPAELRNVADALDELAGVVFRAGAHGLVIHELGDLGTTDRELPHYLSACWRQGRSRRVPVVAATQRPVAVPRMAVSEANHLFAFHLADPRDREIVAPLMGPALVTDPIPPGHRYYYRGPDLTLYRCVPLAR